MNPSDPPSPFELQSDHPLPLQLDLPSPAARAPTVAPLPTRPRAPQVPRTRRMVWAFVAVVVLGTGLAAGALWGLPWYVRRACIDGAAARGVTLAIDDVRLDTDGFQLVGVKATIDDVPNAEARAPDIRITTNLFHPRSMAVRGAVLTLDGPWSNVTTAFAKWRANSITPQADEWVASALVMDGSRLVWLRPVGDNARMQADGVHLEVAFHGSEAEVHMRADHVGILVPGGVLGPWRVDVDRIPAATASTGAAAEGSFRIRIALDPAVPDSSTVLMVGNDQQTTSLDLSIPRSPLAHLGIPAQLLGLRGAALQIEESLHYGAVGPARAELTTKGGIFGIGVPTMPRPIDVVWEGTASGAFATGLDVKNGRMAVGPLVGAITGTVKPFDDGFRLDLAWKANPVPCRAFEAQLDAATPFDVAYQLRKLSEAAGLAKVEGQVSARADLAFDSRDLGVTRLDFAPETRCHIALFAP